MLQLTSVVCVSCNAASLRLLAPMGGTDPENTACRSVMPGW